MTAHELIPLTTADANALKLYETIIEKGMKTFVEVGSALAFIRDGRLYRENHATFEEYLDKRWKLTRSRAYQLINAAAVISNLSTIVDTGSAENLSPIGDIPTSESVARPLAALEPDEQREAWTEAVATAPRASDGTPRVTAAHVRETRERRQQAADAPAPAPVEPAAGQTLRPREKAEAPPDKPKPVIGINEAVVALRKAVERDRASAGAALAALREVAAGGLYGPKTKDAPAAFRDLVEVVGLLIGGAQ